MAIETTLGVIHLVSDPLLRVAAKPCTDVGLRYRVGKLLQAVLEEKRHYDAHDHQLIQELGVDRPPNAFETSRGQRGTVRAVPDQRWDEYMQQLEKLGAQKVTIPLEPLTTTMLEAIPEATAADMVALGPLCVWVEPGDKKEGGQ